MKSFTGASAGRAFSQFEALHRMQDKAIRSASEMDRPDFNGTGIVMVAGGARCFTNAFVGLTILRHDVRCTLPVQVWYLGPEEMSETMMRLLDPFDVELVDAFAVRRRFPMRQLGGWECKPYAIVHSPFRHVILLDADNVALTDPAALPHLPEYAESGAIFWPDIQRLSPESPVWDMCRVEYRNEPEVESGQLVIDKERCWVPLHLALHLNAWSDIYYQYVLGDKETFHLAWRRLGQPYAMPAKPPRKLPANLNTPTGMVRVTCVLEQHDFDGNPIFHHRTDREWVLYGVNPNTGRAALEEKCLAALEQLRKHWDGRVHPDPPTRDGIDGRDLIGTRRYRYRRIGVDERLIEFEADGRIGLGAAANERRWRLEDPDDNPTLVISRTDGDICRLTPDSSGIWRGAWLWYEQMPVELIPVGAGPAAN